MHSNGSGKTFLNDGLKNEILNDWEGMMSRSRKRLKRQMMIGSVMLSLLTSLGFAAKSSAQSSQPILGRYEVIEIEELDRFPIKAKIDTGAYTASLNAIDIEYYEKDGDDWVRFTPVVDDKKLQTRDLPLHKVSRIKQRAEEGADSDDIASSKRPVVEMTVCIGKQKEVIEVNLTNRGHFNYPLLIGAKALRKFDALVDAGKQYIADPACH